MQIKTKLLTALLLTAASAVAQAGPSSFQLTCSNVRVVYQGNQPAITATCLTAAGTPNDTSLIINGVSNQNGVLTQGGGASSFQQSCGNIRIDSSISGATLAAFCRTAAGAFNNTSLPLQNISNQNGVLRQQ